MSTDTRTQERQERKTALVVVDAQQDFTEGWALPVEGGIAVCERIADLLRSGEAHYDAVFATYCWHPADAPFHFVAPGEEPDFQAMWPPHCIAGTQGAENPPALDAALDTVGATRLYKGQASPGYSGFEAREAQDGSGLDLGTLLDEAGVTDLVLGGLALDFCVRATAGDGARWAEAGDRTVTVRRDLTEPVDPAAADRIIEELGEQGVSFHGSPEAPQG